MRLNAENVYDTRRADSFRKRAGNIYHDTGVHKTDWRKRGEKLRIVDKSGRGPPVYVPENIGHKPSGRRPRRGRGGRLYERARAPETSDSDFRVAVNYVIYSTRHRNPTWHRANKLRVLTHGELYCCAYELVFEALRFEIPE